jgi:hypothetical protein
MRSIHCALALRQLFQLKIALICLQLLIFLINKPFYRTLAMIDNVYAPPTSNLNAPRTQENAMFYVVSERKFYVLFIATLGMYSVYWFYKNWATYKAGSSYGSSDAASISPLGRTILAIFFVRALFRRVKERTLDKQTLEKWNDGLHAAILVLLLIVSNVLDRAAMRSLWSPYSDYLSLAILIPLVLSFSKAQVMINVSCGDPQGLRNAEFTKANYAWIVAGLLFWILALIGMLVPE